MLFKTQKSRRAITLIAGACLVMGMGQSLMTLFISSNAPTPQAAVASTETMDLEAGYATVLKREPQNPTALKGLLEARLSKENWKGAKEPLQQLIGLNPEEASLKTLLAEVDRKIASQSKPAKTQESKTP